ncbi:MAG: methyltransferase [Hyphomonadaceae bacterium]|nr:methyltransferase [Hyphomonadaceae bacterium]
MTHLLYGFPHPDLASPELDASQTSPLVPGAMRLPEIAADSAASLLMLAPAGSVERLHDMALALMALAPGAPFTIMAPMDRGGSRLARELAAFGCVVSDEARRHHRICTGERPATLTGIEAAVAAGNLQPVDAIFAFSQPGLFSWDRLDPGTELLIETLSAEKMRGLKGAGADFGCGWGGLSRAVLESPHVVSLTGIDVDGRACEAARINVDDPRFTAAWRDLRASGPDLTGLDFVVMNPPFHATSLEDRGLGQAFIEQAGLSLRKGGRLWLVANVHLPYERALDASFARWELVEDDGAYKVIEAVK